MIKVKLYIGGRMGEIALAVIGELGHVQLVNDFSDDFDILFSASYPSRIPQEECRKARIGAVNIHTGLLPEGRGSNPLNWAIIWGKDRTGVTIHKIVDSYDAGDIVCQSEVPIFETDNIIKVRERVEWAFSNLIAAFFVDPAALLSQATKQNQAIASYAQKRRPEDSELNLSALPKQIWDLYRSCHPVEYPAFVMVDDKAQLVVEASFNQGAVRLVLDNGEVIVR